jgi:hypothetical protein
MNNIIAKRARSRMGPVYAFAQLSQSSQLGQVPECGAAIRALRATCSLGIKLSIVATASSQARSSGERDAASSLISAVSIIDN